MNVATWLCLGEWGGGLKADNKSSTALFSCGLKGLRYKTESRSQFIEIVVSKKNALLAKLNIDKINQCRSALNLT